MSFKTLPEITSVSDMIFDPVWALKFHHSSNHELLHIIKGKMELTYQDGSGYLRGPGDTLFNPAGTVHRDIFELDEELEIFLIHFKWEHAEDFFSRVNNRSLEKISQQADSEIRRIFDLMRYDSGFDEMDRSVANSRLMNILLLIYRDVTYSANKAEENESIESRQKQLVDKAKKYIDRFFRNPIHLEDVAEYLQVSPFYLSRIFNHESDFSFVEYLTEIRLSEAKKLLQEGRYIIADVARMSGYEDSNYFSKVFRRCVGCSPGKYR